MYRIIIIDPDSLVVNTLTSYLCSKGHQVVGWANSYQAATTLFQEQQPDLIVSEVCLDGLQSGIEFAHFVNQQKTPKPLIFLTDQADLSTIHGAKKTFPAGYLTKPSDEHTLMATIEIAMYNYKGQNREKEAIQLYDGKQYHQISVNEILYLRADHNYVHVVLESGKNILQRAPLREILEQLPDEQFLQTHRSYGVNLQQVNRWDGESLHIKCHAIPVSRIRRKKVQQLFRLPQLAS